MRTALSRRAVSGGVLCGVVALLVGGCGGSSGGSEKRSVSGIVLEDDGRGTTRAAGAGVEVRVTTFDQFGVPRLAGVSTRTDAQGRFSVALEANDAYGFVTNTYHKKSTLDLLPRFGVRLPRCAVVPVTHIDGRGALNPQYVTEGGTISFVTRPWAERARLLATQNDVDVAILADLPCTETPSPNFP